MALKSMSKKVVLLPNEAGAAGAEGNGAPLPAATLLAHLATVRRSVREIFNPYAAGAAGALGDAENAVAAMSTGPAATAPIVERLAAEQGRGGAAAATPTPTHHGGTGGLQRGLKAASRWEHEVRSRSSMLARMFGDALAAQPHLTAAPENGGGSGPGGGGAAQGGEEPPAASASKRRRVQHCSSEETAASFQQLHRTLSNEFSNLVLVRKAAVGSENMLEVTLPGVLSATLALRWDAAAASSWNIEQVSVCSVNETGGVGLAGSRTSVFQQVTISANQAALAYAHRGGGSHGGSGSGAGGGGGERGVADFLRWLSSYSNLFTAKCQRCHRILRAENNDFLPPTHRAIGGRMGVPVHATCNSTGAPSVNH